MATRKFTDDERRQRATDCKRRYNNAHYKQLNVYVPIADYEAVVSAAEKSGLSIRQYVIAKLTDKAI